LFPKFIDCNIVAGWIGKRYFVGLLFKETGVGDFKTLSEKLNSKLHGSVFQILLSTTAVSCYFSMWVVSTLNYPSNAIVSMFNYHGG
jgi:hypothetical protein